MWRPRHWSSPLVTHWAMWREGHCSTRCQNASEGKGRDTFATLADSKTATLVDTLCDTLCDTLAEVEAEILGGTFSYVKAKYRSTRWLIR